MKDIAAERGIMSGIFKYGLEAYIDVSDLISVDSLTLHINQKLFKCYEKIFTGNSEAKLDIPTLLSAANSLGFDFENSDDIKHIRAITNYPIELSNVRSLAGKLKKLHIGRELHSQLELSKEKLSQITGDERLDEIRGLVEGPIFDYTTKLDGGGEEGPTLIGVGLREYVQYLADNPTNTVGLSSGFPRYDFAIGGGFRRGTVSMLGARTKVGKSIFAVNVALHVACVLNIPVLYIDTEMGKKDQWPRKLANLSEVKIKDIEKGLFRDSEEDYQKVLSAVDKLESVPYTYYRALGRPFDEIISVARRWLHRNVGFEDSGVAKDCLIIYDYFKLTDPRELTKSGMQEWMLLGYMMNSLVNFMQKYDVPSLALAQLNRDGVEKEDTRVLGGADRILHTISNFTILKDKTDDEINMFPKAGTMKLVNLIDRHGEGLARGDYINIYGKKSYAKLVEGKTLSELTAEAEGFDDDGSAKPQF